MKIKVEKIDDNKDHACSTPLSFLDKIKQYGEIMPVPGDGHCGYHAVMSLLRLKNIISDSCSIMSFRKSLSDFIGENESNVVKWLDYAISFRES